MAIATQPLTVTPAHPLFAAEVSGVDLTRPLDDATFERIAQAFDEYSVLVFHGQALTDEQQMAFSERFGPARDDRAHPRQGRPARGAHGRSLERGRGRQADGLERPADALPVRQPALAHRQLVQAGPRALLGAVRARRTVRGRRDRVRQHARGLRRAARRSPPPGRRPDRRPQLRLLAQPDRPRASAPRSAATIRPCATRSCAPIRGTARRTSTSARTPGASRAWASTRAGS